MLIPLSDDDLVLLVDCRSRISRIACCSDRGWPKCSSYYAECINRSNW